MKLIRLIWDDETSSFRRAETGTAPMKLQPIRYSFIIPQVSIAGISANEMDSACQELVEKYVSTTYKESIGIGYAFDPAVVPLRIGFASLETALISVQLFKVTI
jgi:hypothetical protein